ncbi:helix-turn-helix domain-containing protein [Bacillus sp. T33-2]|uniref:helix-turn-helix domain-containing protein n=1 Tax=Bacillus sp. T33-2 TaxID=2054168 RepID=UPI000C793DCF|nr:helix-turn-helix transcriptional regulator [Bacillus sp. T33-2]PLR99548.1 XRE family transcriptional regulator [Bacillus sp. T33-2]
MSSRDILGKCLLLELLQRSYMTQADLATKTGISKSQINEYIKNTRMMTLPNAKLIANALKCHIDDLYEWNIWE